MITRKDLKGIVEDCDAISLGIIADNLLDSEFEYVMEGGELVYLTKYDSEGVMKEDELIDTLKEVIDTISDKKLEEMHFLLLDIDIQFN